MLVVTPIPDRRFPPHVIRSLFDPFTNMFSFWQQDAFLSQTDVIIVGAGFAGLWCAYELKTRQPNLKITVLDKEPIPGGASVRNAGFACFGSPGEMLTDKTTMGEEAMWQTVAMRYKGIQKLRVVLGDAAIDYDPCGGYECFTSLSQFQAVKDGLAWLNSGMKSITGVDDAFTIVDDQLPLLGLAGFEHLVVNRLEGGLHSGKALRTLLQKVVALGVNILFSAKITKWESVTDGVLVQASANEPVTLKASRLLIATNAFTAQLLPSNLVHPARGQALITEPIEGLPLKGTFHFDEGFYYWRNVGNRILLGGARNTSFTTENTFEANTSDAIQQALEAFLTQHIPLPKEIKTEHRWAGIMGFTQNKKPLIDHPAPNVWAVVACNRMGVALTPAIAEEVALQILA